MRNALEVAPRTTMRRTRATDPFSWHQRSLGASLPQAAASTNFRQMHRLAHDRRATQLRQFLDIVTATRCKEPASPKFARHNFLADAYFGVLPWGTGKDSIGTKVADSRSGWRIALRSR